MGSKKAIAALRSCNPEIWEQYVLTYEKEDEKFSNNYSTPDKKIIDLTQEDLSGYNFSKIKLSDIDFTKTNLSNCNFKNTEIKNCIFSECKLVGTDFSDAFFEGNRFIDCECNSGTSFKNIKSENGVFGGPFKNVDFRDADLALNSFVGAKFLGADLRGTRLRQASLGRTVWQDAIIDKKTDFTLAFFLDHDATNDKSEFITYPKWFSWQKTRKIGSLPIFGFSWVSLLASLFVVNTIGTISTIYPVIFTNFIPYEMTEIIASTLFLAFGSTIYRLGCPEEIQEFTEIRWVFEHRHPRIQYISKSLQKTGGHLLSLLLLAVGGGIGLLIVSTRITTAFIYIFFT